MLIKGVIKTSEMKKDCPKCGSSQGAIFPSGNTIHAAKLICAECDRFLRWLSIPDYNRAKKMDLINYE